MTAKENGGVSFENRRVLETGALAIFFLNDIYLKAFSITPKTEREWLFFELLF